MKKVSAARAIVEIMEREGADKAFCVPGESFLSVMDELYGHPRIQLVSGRHEGGVSFMAEAYAKASGKVGVCLASRGPGAANLSIGLHTAYQDSTPVVAFIGQVERDFRHRESFQEVDLADYFRNLVKWSVEVPEANRVPELVTRAFHIAKSGRPGPVLVSLPQDILDEEIEAAFHETEAYYAPRPEKEAVMRAHELLKGAERPVIIAGGGVTSRAATPLLADISERMNIPVAAAFRRYDVFPNNHPNFIGSLNLAVSSALVEYIREADVVLALGTRLSQMTTKHYSLLHPETTLIHVDVSVDELNKVYAPAVGIVSDAKSFLADLHEVCKNDEHTRQNASAAAARKAYVQYATPRKIYSDAYVNLEGMLYDLRNTLPKDAVITCDAGNFSGWLDRFYSYEETNTFVGPTSGAMGYGLPAAIGAKLAHPEKVAVAYCGDGGFMMTMQELETAIRYDIPVIALVANNNKYGTIRMHQEAKFPERVIGTDLTNPDYAQFVETMGGHGEAVHKNDDFIPALKRALAAKKPAVIELMIDPDQISVKEVE